MNWTLVSAEFTDLMCLHLLLQSNYSLNCVQIYMSSTTKESDQVRTLIIGLQCELWLLLHVHYYCISESSSFLLSSLLALHCFLHQNISNIMMSTVIFTYYVVNLLSYYRDWLATLCDYYFPCSGWLLGLRLVVKMIDHS